MTRDGILRKTVTAGAVAACLASACVLSSPLRTMAAEAGPPPADAAWITGVVVDANGDPVVGDLVNAIGPREVPEAGILAERSQRRDFTDQHGAFRVRQASPNGYLVSICTPEPSYKKACRETAQGVDHMITYVGPAGVTDSWVLQTSLFKTTDADRDLGEITVKPQSFVHGTIERAANQSIRLLRLNGTVAYYNSTDEQGDYRFQGLAPGRYRVAAGGDGWRPWLSDIVTLPPDGDVEVNGVLDRGAAIHGVATSDGDPVPFIDILVRRAGGEIVAATTTNENGYYRVSGLRPGHFRVGVSYYGTEYRRQSVAVSIDEPDGDVGAKLNLVKGAVITVALRAGGDPATRASDELRDSTGHAILGQMNFDGRLTYRGLSPGDYTVVAGTDKHFTVARVHVTTARTYDLGTRVLDRPTLTLTGTTAPRAVVEAYTGNACPPGEDTRPGSFHSVERADEAGRYALHGLVPGRYMLGSDGWPSNYAPYCRTDVPITHDRRAALPLQVGSTATGRLVYASTGTPVITTLAYELFYPPGSTTNPTDEHPTRDRTTGATGRFLVDRLAAGDVTGELAITAGDQITSPKFLVIYPFQDGTPYYLTTRARPLHIGAQEDVQLGDIPLYLHEAP